MNCDIRGNYNFEILILIFMKEHIKNYYSMIIAGIFTKQKCFLKGGVYVSRVLLGMSIDI